MAGVSDKVKWAAALILGGAVMLVAIVGAVVSRGEDSQTKPAATLKQSESRMTQAEMRARLEHAQTQRPRDRRDQMEHSIASHYARIQEAPDDPEAPALFLAMGNLHRRMFNYDEAIWAYQQIFTRYPDWDGLPMVYGELASCYEESGDHANMLRLYMEMMEAFPEGTPEHHFARRKLDMEDADDGEQLVESGL